MPGAATGGGWYTLLIQAIRQLPHRQLTRRVNSLDQKADTGRLFRGLQ